MWNRLARRILFCILQQNLQNGTMTLEKQNFWYLPVLTIWCASKGTDIHI